MICKKIETLHEQHRARLGSPRMRRHLELQHGILCSRGRVSRLMRKMGIRGKQNQAYRPTTTKPGSLIFADALKGRPLPVLPGCVWVSDITYIPTKEGFLYLCAIMDLATRQVVAWDLQNHMRSSLVANTLKKAARAMGHAHPSQGQLIFHSDQGSQYSSGEVIALLKKQGIHQSMSHKGVCYDNAYAESLWSTLKRETLSPSSCFDSHAHAKSEIALYLDGYYNGKRVHSSLGMMSPDSYAQRLIAASKNGSIQGHHQKPKSGYDGCGRVGSETPPPSGVGYSCQPCEQLDKRVVQTTVNNPPLPAKQRKTSKIYTSKLTKNLNSLPS